MSDRTRAEIERDLVGLRADLELYVTPQAKARIRERIDARLDELLEVGVLRYPAAT